MVKSSRFASFMLPLALYAATLGACGYFVNFAVFGARGLKARATYKTEMNHLTVQLAETRLQKQRWSHRVDLIKGGFIDEDLLDEQARKVLGRVNPNDVVIMVAKPNGE